jgi:hypothetical protein
MKELNQLICDMATCQIEPLKAVYHNVAFKHGDAVSHTIAAVQKHCTVQTLGKQGH